MNRVATDIIRLEDYSGIVPEQLLSEVTKISKKLKGLRIVHVSATPRGGGVAEILRSLTPLMCDVGIDARWFALSPDEPFCQVSKTLINCLQGSNSALPEADINHYLLNNRKAADTMKSMGITADIWMIHDIQVLPMLSYMGPCTGIWVCHTDITKANGTVESVLLPHMSKYRSIVASIPENFPDSASPNEVVVFPPAIDPLQPKHETLSFVEAREILTALGMDPTRPIISQVSRFDRWKDPWGVVDAYRLARKRVPGLQLALVDALTARNDRNAMEIVASLKNYADGDPNIFLFSDPMVIGDAEVNAFQSGSDVILQKSTWEGFGLTVAEAMWKGRAVIGGNCAGIRHQIRDGLTGYLVDDIATCAERIVRLLKDRTLADLMGNAGRESVREYYLMPRLLRDYLQLALSLQDKQGRICAASTDLVSS